MNKFEAILKAIQKDPGNRGLARNPERNLFNAFPNDLEKACRSIAEHPNPHVAILTGFIIDTTDPPMGETDGPLGAVFLADILDLRFEIPSLILTDPFAMKAIRIGMWQTTDYEKVPIRAANEKLPDNITHLISIERVGPNHRDGRCLSMRGRDITDLMLPVEHLFVDKNPNLITIGIGDGGNEIGMGKMPREIIADNIPDGDRIACRTATDHLIVAGVSNWGAYALAAGIAHLRDNREAYSWFEPFTENRLLRDMVELGSLVDGVTGKPTATVDGLTWEQYGAPLDEIGAILRRL